MADLEPGSPLFRPLTISEAQARTGRSRRTIARWIADGRLSAYEAAHPRRILLVEGEVLDVEKRTRDAGRRGRPPRITPDGDA